MKKIATFLLFLLVFLTAPTSKAKAQSCECVVVEGLTTYCDSIPEKNNCGDGYIPDCDLVRGGTSTPTCGGCECVPGDGSDDDSGDDDSDTTVQLKLCNSLPGGEDSPDYKECIKCMVKKGEGEEGGGKEGDAVWTGLGCISTSPSGLITDVLRIATGLGGGIAFIMLLFGAFQMTTSSGDPKAMDAAKQTISGAITGLLVIIFSVILLNFIGVQVLKIPGF